MNHSLSCFLSFSVYFETCTFVSCYKLFDTLKGNGKELYFGISRKLFIDLTSEWMIGNHVPVSSQIFQQIENSDIEVTKLQISGSPRVDPLSPPPPLNALIRPSRPSALKQGFCWWCSTHNLSKQGRGSVLPTLQEFSVGRNEKCNR